jgi:putative spermidine/putrescine transport system permease protein
MTTGAYVDSQATAWRRGYLAAARLPLARIALVGPAVVLLTIILYLPLAWLLTQSFGAEGHSSIADNYSQLVTDHNVLRSYWTSLWLAVVTVAIVAVVGYPLAYSLASLRPRAASALFIVVLVPFWSSLTVTLFAFELILGNDGPINKALEFLHVPDTPLKLLFNAISVIVGFVYVGLPLMVLPLYAAMRRIDRSLMSAASTLGATPRQAFVQVFLPLSLPGVVAGATLVFVTTVGYFVVPQLLGGQGENTIGQFIVHEVQVQQDIPSAGAMTVGLIAMTLVFLVLVDRLVGLERFWSRAAEDHE